MSPNVVEGHTRLLGERDRVVDAPHRDHADGAAGPVHELDLGRQQVLEAVAVDGVRVAAAHLHHAPGLAGRHEPGDLRREPPRQLGRAVLVDVLHGVACRAGAAGLVALSHLPDFVALSHLWARARALEPFQRDPCVTEEHVARGGVRDEVDGHALIRPGDPHDRLGAVHGHDLGLDGLVGAGDAPLGREPGHTVPRRSSSSSRCSSAPRCEQRQRLAGVVLVDAREREPDVDQHPVADLDRRRGLVHERDADLAPHAGDVDPREARVAVDDARSPVRVCQGTLRGSKRCGCDCSLTVTDAAVVRRDETVREDAEARLLQPAAERGEQAQVLEAAAREDDRPGRARCRRRPRANAATTPSWKAAAISARGRPAARSSNAAATRSAPRIAPPSTLQA